MIRVHLIAFLQSRRDIMPRAAQRPLSLSSSAAVAYVHSAIAAAATRGSAKSPLTQPVPQALSIVAAVRPHLSKG